MFLFKINLFTFLFFFASTYLLAQEEFFVFDRESNQAIKEVYVFDLEEEFSSLSDENGRIIWENSEAAFLRLTHPSYRSLDIKLGMEFSWNDTIYLDRVVGNISEIVLKVNRMDDRLLDLFEDISIIPAKSAVLENNPPTAADLLEHSGKVFVQKSQQGGGSPVLRGLEASRVLLMVDGLRMNNAIYRSGHLQNSVTIDPAILESVEIKFGPSSLLHGSDALGGLVHYRTIDPLLSANDKLKVDGTMGMWVSSATAEFSQHGHFSIGKKKWAYLGSFSKRTFGDLRIGKNRREKDGAWGLRPEYIATFDGQDSIIVNDDPNKMRFTAYDQIDWIQKLRYRPNNDWDFILNLQSSSSSNIPRFDRLNDYRDGVLRFAQWDYGPQKRFMSSFTAKYNRGNRWFDKAVFQTAYQAIQESRIRRIYQSSLQETQLEQLKAIHVNVDFRKEWNKEWVLQYGAELWWNYLNSSAFQKDINTPDEIEVAIETRYPDGKASMSSTASFASLKFIPNGSWKFSGGMRLNGIGLNTAYDLQGQNDFPFEGTSGSNLALTLALSAKYFLSENTNFTMNLSSGFRAPNIDDVGKLFDPFLGAVVVPNAEVNAEKSYTLDLQFSSNLTDALMLEVDGFYSYLDDLIRRSFFQVAGQDSIVFSGINSRVYANTNVGKAVIWGGSLQMKFRLTNGIEMEKSIVYTYGRDLDADAPLGHIPPLYGSLRVKAKRNRYTANFSLLYNAAKTLEQYSTFSEDKLEEARFDGTPAWWLIHLDASYRINKQVRVSVALENIADKHYRPFSSGISGAGRNFKAGLYWVF